MIPAKPDLMVPISHQYRWIYCIEVVSIGLGKLPRCVYFVFMWEKEKRDKKFKVISCNCDLHRCYLAFIWLPLRCCAEAVIFLFSHDQLLPSYSYFDLYYYTFFLYVQSWLFGIYICACEIIVFFCYIVSEREGIVLFFFFYMYIYIYTHHHVPKTVVEFGLCHVFNIKLIYCCYDWRCGGHPSSFC